MTFKQINYLTKTIFKSIIDERKYEASLHNKKIKEEGNFFDEEDAEISEDAAKILDKVAEEDFKKWVGVKT